MTKKRGDTRNGIRNLALEVLLYFLSTLFIISLWKNNLVVLMLMLLVWLFALKFWHSREDIIFFLAAAFFGPLGEIVAIHFGVWAYANPSMLGIPVWLPFAWGYVGMLIRRLSITISEWRGWE